MYPGATLDGPKTRDAWAGLARLFREESARYPDLRHVLIDLPEAVEIPDNVEAEADRARKARNARRAHLDDAFAMAASIAGDTHHFRFPHRVSLPDRAQEHVFHGDPGGLDSRSWRPFVDLARVGVELATSTGVIDSTPLPDPLSSTSQAWHWAGTWMNLVYRLARERRPGSLLHVQEWSTWKGKTIPKGMTVASLAMSVFIASAYAAEQLAREAEARTGISPPGPPKPELGLSVSGNDVTVDGVTYQLDDARAAFVKELVDAVPGVWVSGSEMGTMVQPRPDRVFAKLPEPIRAKIGSETGKGYRITRA
jgi:hypothetical protein